MKTRLLLALMLCAALAAASEELAVDEIVLDAAIIAALPERTNCTYTVTLRPERVLWYELSEWLKLPEPLAGLLEMLRDFADDLEEALLTSPVSAAATHP